MDILMDLEEVFRLKEKFIRDNLIMIRWMVKAFSNGLMGECMKEIGK